MKYFRLIPALLALGFLAGCATLNQNDQALLQQHHVSPALYDRMLHERPLALPDIVELTNKHLSSDFIIYYLSSTHVSYHLNREDIAYLKKGGVSQQVINYLISTPPRYYAPAPYPYYYPAVNYYYAPGYYPPRYYGPAYYPYPVYPRVFIGGGYYRGGYYGPYRHGYWH